MFDQITDGRTDLVFDYVAAGHAATSADQSGVSLLQWCSYYGDVSAIKSLLANGGHSSLWESSTGSPRPLFMVIRGLCQFLIEEGADVNMPQQDTGETPLHAALCTANRQAHDSVIKVLLANGANPNCVTKPSAGTDHFMLLDAGALIDAKDMNGDSALGWASWYLRHRSILRMLCYGEFHA